MKNIFIACLCFFGSSQGFSQEFTLEQFAQGISSPVEMTHAGDQRLFVVEQTGKIKIINPDGTINPTPFLNLSNLITAGGEQGLLGLAFAPDYAITGRFYVDYTNQSGDTVIARYTVSEDPNVANTTGTILLTIDQPFSNHNGGCIKFGPDGFLWISTGDGGSGGDPFLNGQNTNVLLGKMLRIDVSGDTYTIPSGNPFVGQTGKKQEIWSYGLRNAWKFSFDKETNEVWIADVGQGDFEEINKQPSTTTGLNYGWSCYEGNEPYNSEGCADPESMIFPLAIYDHSSGRCSLTGGYIYRGSLYENLQGKYFFADYCSGEIGWIDQENNLEFIEETPYSITTFGEDVNGELYVGGSGKIFKIKGNPMSSAESEAVKLSIYPNPVINQIHIQSNITLEEVKIYNMSGKLLLNVKENLDVIDFSKYPKGTYIITIKGNKFYKTEKIIKK